MQTSPVLLIIIASMIGGSFLAFAIERFSFRLSGAFAATLLFASLISSILFPISGTFVTLFDVQYIGRVNFFSDGMSSILILATLGISAAIAVYTTRYFERAAKGGFFTLYLLFITGLVGLFSSSNILFLFLFLELMLISAWLLIGGWGGEKRNYAALKYFIYTELGALLLLFGFVMLGGIAGSFDLLALSAAPAMSQTLLIALSLVFVGALIKSGAFPLHGWLPDAYYESAYPVTAIFSFATVAVGGYLFIRIFYSFAPSAFENYNIRFALVVLGLINIIYGSFMSIHQGNMKRLLAYSSISQVGYMLIGVASGSVLGILGVTIFSVAHGLAKSSLFMVSGSYKKLFETEDITKFSGLAGKMPITSSALLSSFLSLSGIPPFLGFWGEFFILLPFAYTVLGPTLNLAGLGLVVAVIVSTIFTMVYSLWAVRRTLYGEPNTLTQKAKDPPLALWLPILIFVIGLIILGLYPSLLTQSFWIFSAGSP